MLRIPAPCALLHRRAASTTRRPPCSRRGRAPPAMIEDVETCRLCRSRRPSLMRARAGRGGGGPSMASGHPLASGSLGVRRTSRSNRCASAGSPGGPAACGAACLRSHHGGGAAPASGAGGVVERCATKRALLSRRHRGGAPVERVAVVRLPLAAAAALLGEGGDRAPFRLAPVPAGGGSGHRHLIAELRASPGAGRRCGRFNSPGRGGRGWGPDLVPAG